MAAPSLQRVPQFADRLRAHIAIMRIDHWTKNVFVFPGIVVPLTMQPTAWHGELIVRILLGILSVCLIASSNYVINEMLDAPFDRLHPVKKTRPAALGLVNMPAGYAQWLLLMLAGMGLAWQISTLFAVSVFVLWIMGCAYNIRPLRTKDIPYLDVLSESVNNPLRMLAGWYIVTDQLVPPASMLSSYWMVGCYFMALKRFSELRQIGSREHAARYRKSFRYYTDRSLLAAVLFYASSGMLFFGAFLIRYRIELVLAFPLVALVMAIYFNLAFEKDSAVQNPEYLYRQKGLMIAVVSCALAMVALLWFDIPQMHALFPATPTGR